MFELTILMESYLSIDNAIVLPKGEHWLFDENKKVIRQNYLNL